MEPSADLLRGAISPSLRATNTTTLRLYTPFGDVLRASVEQKTEGSDYAPSALR